MLQKSYIFYFNDSYTSLNIEKSPEEPRPSFSSIKTLDVSCITQVVVNKIFETGITQKIIADSSTTQHFIAN